MGSKYSEEFKRDAVKLVLERGGRRKLVASELGINHWTLKDWQNQYAKETREEMVQKGQIKLTSEEELRLLKKELADVQEERDILKKAIAVFSKKPKINTSLF
jgi:transposase